MDPAQQQVYLVTKTSEQDSQDQSQPQGKTVIIVSKTLLDVPSEAQTSQNISSDLSAIVGKSSLQILDHANLDSMMSRIDRLVYVFTAPHEELMNSAISTADRGRRKETLLVKLLHSPVWTQVAEIRTSNPSIEISLFSGETSVSLESFRDAIERLVDDRVVSSFVSAMGSVDRTKFWQLLICRQGSNTSTAEDYSYTSALPSDFDLLQSTPRTVPQTKPRIITRAGSETSDSTEEGNHGS